MSYLSGLLDRKGQKAGARLLSCMPKEFVWLKQTIVVIVWLCRCTTKTSYLDLELSPFGIVSMRRHTLCCPVVFEEMPEMWQCCFITCIFKQQQKENMSEVGSSNIANGGTRQMQCDWQIESCSVSWKQMCSANAIISIPWGSGYFAKKCRRWHGAISLLKLKL